MKLRYDDRYVAMSMNKVSRNSACDKNNTSWASSVYLWLQCISSYRMSTEDHNYGTIHIL